MMDRLRLLPLLAFYVAVILVGPHQNLSGDQQFYLRYVDALGQVLTGGGAELDLGTGPGYPLFLLLLQTAGLPLLGWRLANAALLLGAVWYVHATLRLYLPRLPALWFAVLFGLYPPLLKESFYLLSECLAMLLACGFLFHFCRLHRGAPRPILHRTLAGGFAAWLILTKVFFSYVFVVLVVLCALGWLWRRQAAAAHMVRVGILALLLCTPYLAHTYGVTGRLFYWAYTGGESLYWMSTPHPGEYGEWHPDSFRGIDRLRANHEAFFATLPAGRAAREPALRQQAMRNIREHPGKFFINWCANVGRLLFSYPFSYRLQTPLTLLLIVPNAFVVVFTVLCAYPSVRAHARIPSEIKLLLLFVAVALGGSSLLAAYERQFRPLVPILLLWISYSLTHLVRIELRAGESA